MMDNRWLIGKEFNVGMLAAFEGKQNESKDMTHLHRLVLIVAVVGKLARHSQTTPIKSALMGHCPRLSLPHFPAVGSGLEFPMSTTTFH